MASNEDSFIYFSPNSFKFEQFSKSTNVFFDETNKQLFTVRSGGVLGVQVQGPTPEFCHTFRMQDKGNVLSIKLSPCQTILAVQRCKNNIYFYNLNDGELEEVAYYQGSRYKGAEILGSVWSQADEIIIISTHGVELFQVLAEKRCTRSLRYIPVSVKWFSSCPASSLLLLASGATATTMQPISYSQRGNIEKTPKFQIDVPITSSNGTLLERDVTVAKLYDQTCILVTRHPPRPPGASPPLAQILVYSMHKSQQTVRRTHTLSLDVSGKIAISVVDNLILVHHQPSKCTLLFDTAGDTGSKLDDSPAYHKLVHPMPGRRSYGLLGNSAEASEEPVVVKPFISGRSIRGFMAELPGQEPFRCQLYSPNWVVFQPNIIIDVKIGFFWYLEIDLPMLIASAPPTAKLVEVLLRRKADVTLPLVLELIEKICEPSKTSARNLTTIAEVFDVINAPYQRQLSSLTQARTATPASAIGTSGASPYASPSNSFPDMIVVDQSLMYSNVFSKFPEKKGTDSYDGEFGIKVILEYIRSLSDVKIPVRDLNELLITCLMNEDHGLSRLHQLLQYRVLSDSKPLACTLVSLEKVYPPALQIALDMLKRLGTADDEIIEILLHKGLVIPTLRYAVAVGLGDQISVRKFLEAAQQTGDRAVFYSVFRFFEVKKQRQRGATGFMKGELCDPFVEHFRKLFIEPQAQNLNSVESQVD